MELLDFMKLLTIRNPKIAKGLKLGYLTNILHLAPSDMSGRNVCPMATAGCKAACLNTAGRGGLFAGKSHLQMTGTELVSAVKTGDFSNNIQKARIARTNWFFNDRPSFMLKLFREIQLAIRVANRHSLIPVFRLNGTSDIRWENVPVTIPHKNAPVVTFPNIMSAFPDIRFYDYSKLWNRTVYATLPANYDLTFSLAEDNDAHARTALENGMNVAVVFRTKNLPATFFDVPVINGDENDLRFLDPKGVIVGLKAKGKAKKDTSGFVRDV
jgi:hypothetical protein